MPHDYRMIDLPKIYAVSACLLGTPCRYNGKPKVQPAIFDMLGAYPYIAICPETMGGAPTPRKSCEIHAGTGRDVLNGKAIILDIDGADITQAMLSGSRMATELCLSLGVKKAFLQGKSPSCGCGEIYDGTFSGTLRTGNGVFAEMLLAEGIEVIMVRGE